MTRLFPAPDPVELLAARGGSLIHNEADGHWTATVRHAAHRVRKSCRNLDRDAAIRAALTPPKRAES